MSQEECEYLNNRYTKSLQGVIRLGLTNAEVVNMIHKLDPPPSAFVVCTEDIGTDTEHTHFMIQSNNSKTNIRNTRKQFKEYIMKYHEAPNKYQNGMLNVSKVREPVRMLIYLSKQHIPDFIHNYPKGVIEKLSKLSYEKKTTMTQAIHLLKEQYYLSQITLEEYILKYRKLRIDYKKPDPMWRKEYDRMEELKMTDQEMEEEIENYIKIKYRGYE